MAQPTSSPDPRQLRQQLRLAQARNHLLARLLQMRSLDELRQELSQAWLEELRDLGVPACGMSLQWPAGDGVHYVTHGTRLFHSPTPRRELLTTCPWVQQAWSTGRPVRVDRQAMGTSGYAGFSAVILETPLPGGGSLGLASTDESAFDAEQVAIVEDLAALIPEAIRRLDELEALRDVGARSRADLALQRVRTEVQRMQDPEGWAAVVRTTAQAMGPLIPFWSCSINLVDLEADVLTAFGIDGGGDLERHVIRGVHPAVRRCLETAAPVYRRTRQDPLFDPGFIPRLHCVLDVPFAGGTLAVNAEAEAAFTDGHVALLRQFAEVVAEGHLRQRDLEALRQREAQLQQGRVLESVGQLAGGVAHQLNNPLTAVIGFAQLQQRRADVDADLRTALETIEREAWRAHGIAARLLDFSRRQRGGRQRLDLDGLVTESLALLGPVPGSTQVDLDLAAAPAAILAQAGQVQQLLLALLGNAFAQKPGTVRVATRAVDAVVRLEVVDDGGGVPAAVRPRIFDPFFTTRLETNAVGLGLSLALRIATEHGGRLWHEDVPGGARFVLELPTL